MAAALALDMADRPPTSAWGHTFDLEWDVETLAAGTIEIARHNQLDFVKLQVRATCFAETFGAAYEYSGSPAAEPLLLRPGATTLNDWRRIAEGGHDPGPLEDQVQVLSRVAQALSPEVPVIQTVFSPGMVAWFLTGRDIRLLDRLLREEPDLMAAGLSRIGELLARFTIDSVGAGAAGVFYAINPFADVRMMSTDGYSRTYLPSDLEAIAPAESGWFNMLHLCGPRINRDFIARLPMSCVNWSTHDDGNPSLTEVRDQLHVAVAGGLHRHSLIEVKEPGEILAAAAMALAETGGRGHLLTPGCSVSPWAAARDPNLEAMRRAALNLTG